MAKFGNHSQVTTIAWLLAVWCALAATSLAQTGTTSLRGVITDRTGAVLPSAHVALDDRQRGTHLERSTSSAGEYLFTQVQPGNYTLTAEAAGFARQQVRVVLVVAQPGAQDVSMAVAGSDVVTVEASSPALNTTDATLGDALESTAVQQLPSEGRNVPDLLSLQPGVLYLGHTINANLDSRSGAVAGARSDQGNVTLDGVDNNNQVQGFAFTGVLRSTLDSVDEFRVVTTGTNADVGRSSGAQVEIVTRSGTNAFHGSLYEYNRNTDLAANNWFNKQGQAAEGEPNRPGKLIRNTFGAAVGGPIKKDRLFFFGNYEGQRTAENVQTTLVVPTAAFRAGNISYLSSGNAVTLTPAQFAAMDPRCSATGTCPTGPGANPAVLAILQQYPLPNGSVLGDGLNTGSYTYSAPAPGSLNTGIARFDWVAADRHRFFARGNLQDDTAAGTPQFPGTAPGSRTRDNTKGLAAGWTWTATQNLVNNLRFGYVRQGYGSRGIGQGSYVNFDPATISNLEAETRTSVMSVPVENWVDDVTWTKGRHTFGFGVNDRLVHNQLSSDALSYDSAATIGFDVTGSGFAGTKQSFDPAQFGLPAVDGQLLPDGSTFHPEQPSFVTSYNSAVANLAGIISQVTNQYNYVVSTDGTTGTLAAQGALIRHDFKSNELEWYVQDSWRARPNLTITFGLRHLLAQTPYEVNGQQAQPVNDVHAWFAARAANAAAGVPDLTPLQFAPSGQARGLKPYYPMQKANLAPRLAVAFAPNERTSIRAGFGLVYDHFGQALVSTFAQYGSYGLQGFKQTPNDALSPDNAPRFSSLHSVPDVNGPTPATVSYPFTPSTDPTTTGFATAVGLDDHLKTPYSYTMDLSVERQMPRGFTLEAAYVGRLGRHLLEQTDLAAPANFVDPASGTDFYTAARELTLQADAGAATVAPVAYFEHLFPDAAGAGADGTGTAGSSATQNIYKNLFVSYPVNASYIQYSLDVLCSPGCGGAHGRFYNPQFNSLFSWTSNGTSNYNALQLILRHPMAHGLQTDVSYTLSKSLDLGSDAERTCLQCGGNGASTFSWIVNAFKPAQNYGPSDFDTRHLVTADWLYLLPIGRGQRFAGGAGRVVDAAIGGWQMSGIARWTSGLPFSVINGTGWEVDWSKQSALVVTGHDPQHLLRTRTHQDANGAPQAFADAAALLASIGNGGPLRNPLPGESGTRNAFRGDGYFGVDAGLSKFFTVHEEQRLRLSWEVFNATNSVRFDTNPINSLQNQTGVGSFGVYGATLTQPRVQQIALRLLF